MSVFKGTILEDRSCVVEGRVVDKTRAVYVAANIASIWYRVVRKDTRQEIVPLTELTPVDSYIIPLFDDWANFRHVIGDTVFTEGATEYQIQYKFVGTDGTVGGGLVEPETEDLIGV